MALLTLTNNAPAYTFYVNTELVIGFGPDPNNPGGSQIFMMTGPYWNLGSGQFFVKQSPAAIAAMWPVDMVPGGVPLADLATTGTASATTFLRGDGAWTTLTQP